MIVDAALLVLSVPVLVWTGYLGLLALLSARTAAPASAASPQTRFDVIVPAHDEEAGIAATVASLLAADYPADMRRVVVVADNCSDGTAVRAANAGAIVLERHDPTRRGKGYALAHAFAHSLAKGGPDAVVVVDADTQVTPNLLRAFDARFSSGAAAAQAEYCVANRDASWRTRLMHVAFTLFHDVRSRARERLGVSAGLRGNGMGFSAATLREVPHDAFSIVEDVEYGIRLGLEGKRVHYVGEAQVFGEMVSSERASRSQRQRWEGGRFALARERAPGLLAAAVSRRSLMLLDLAMDLLVPPLTYVVLATGLGVIASAAWLAFGVHEAARSGAAWALGAWIVAALSLAIYVVRGLWLARVGVRGLVDLMRVPFYMLWKIGLALRPAAASRGEWVRTAREEKQKP